MKHPNVAVDSVIMRGGKVLLIKRKFEPHRGRWALPGGAVDYGETLKDAVVREVEEETGVKVEPVKLLTILDEPGRDPRGHVVSVVFLCKILGGKPRPGSDAEEVGFFSDVSGIEIAFDHRKVVEDALKSEV